MVERLLANLLSEVPGLYANHQVSVYTYPGDSGRIPDVLVLSHSIESPKTYRTHQTDIPTGMFVEIVSKSQAERKRDLETKVEYYQKAGAERYLIIDLPKKEFHFHHFVNQTYQVFPADGSFFPIGAGVELAWDGHPRNIRVRYENKEIRLNEKAIQTLENEVEDFKHKIQKKDLLLDEKATEINKLGELLQNKKLVIDEQSQLLDQKDQLIEQLRKQLQEK